MVRCRLFTPITIYHIYQREHLRHAPDARQPLTFLGGYSTLSAANEAAKYIVFRDYGVNLDRLPTNNPNLTIKTGVDAHHGGVVINISLLDEEEEESREIWVEPVESEQKVDEVWMLVDRRGVPMSFHRSEVGAETAAGKEWWKFGLRIACWDVKP